MLSPGTRFAAYEIRSVLGVGGMGEVYGARDIRLGRDVAIKILSPQFTSIEDLLARFEREARMLASLNHPHIGAIYGVEESAGVRALVLELVEGETLAERIARGVPQPSAATPGLLPAIAEALSIARQIAEALDAAHEKGIIHRDLKPANIKITPDGTVKVLDFGLAKEAAGKCGAADLTQLRRPSPSAGTRHGVILGTAAYMSPEQTRGQAVDKRTDIWAFGCVLFEMLTGPRGFARRHRLGHDRGDSGTRTRPERVTRRRRRPPSAACFNAVSKRIRSCVYGISVMRGSTFPRHPMLTAFMALSIAVPEPRRQDKTVAVIGSAAAIVVAAAAVAVLLRPSAPTSARPMPIRFSVPAPEGAVFTGSGVAAINTDVERTYLALSPDGTQLAFIVEERPGSRRIWLRAFSAIEAQPIAGTENASSLFWSPDSQSIAFVAGNRLMTNSQLRRRGGVHLRRARRNRAVWLVGQRRRHSVCVGRRGRDFQCADVRRHAGRDRHGRSGTGRIPCDLALVPARRPALPSTSRGWPTGAGS